MDILRAIWRGPFYIGRLERPVSVGDAIMKVLETGWRLLIICCCLLVAVVAVFSAQSAYQSGERERLRESIIASAVYAPDSCSAAYPLRIEISNQNNRRIVEHTSYSIHAHHPSRSDDLTDYTWHFLTTDARIGPGEIFASCFALPVTGYGPREVIYSIEINNVTFAE